MENNQNLSNKELHDIKRQEKISERESVARKKKAKSLFIWTGVLAGIALVLWGMVALIDSQPGNVLGALPAPVTADDHYLGNVSSTAVLVEYGDYQCPACAAYHNFTKQLTDEFGGNIAFVYRYFPLRNIHDNANISAQAAEAAGLQGKYWEMHDLLFENQNDWVKSSSAEKIFEGYASNLGLDLEKFKTDIDSDTVKAKIEKNLAEAEVANLRGTPSFFLNGQSIENPQSYEEFRNLILQTGATPAAN